MAALLICLSASAVFGAELHVPMVTGIKGEAVTFPIVVDKVENLAGIKLSLTYDQKVLKYVKAEKSSYTVNMLHVVNDRVPGRLIVVMAAAKGFAGENAPLVAVTFELLQDVSKEDKIPVQVTEAELMSDKLQKIEVKLQ